MSFLCYNTLFLVGLPIFSLTLNAAIPDLLASTTTQCVLRLAAQPANLSVVYMEDIVHHRDAIE